MLERVETNTLDAGATVESTRITLHGVGEGAVGAMPVVLCRISTGAPEGPMLVHLPLPEAKALVAAIDRVASRAVRR